MLGLVLNSRCWVLGSRAPLPRFGRAFFLIARSQKLGFGYIELRLKHAVLCGFWFVAGLVRVSWAFWFVVSDLTSAARGPGGFSPVLLACCLRYGRRPFLGK